MAKLMKKLSFLLALAMLFSVCSSHVSAASGDIIDHSTANSGYISVTFADASGAKFQLGIRHDYSSTEYIDYKANTTAKVTLEHGSGKYTVALFKKIGSSYVSMAQASFTANIKAGTQTSATEAAQTTEASQATVTVETSAAATSAYPEYLKSVKEISWYAGDSVSKKAAELCKGKKTDQAKILAIYNYIAKNFKYDNDFANKVRAGTIRTYTPDPVSALSNKKGVCYDFSSLFAAMCRSQGIPCKLVKGYSTKINGYHAWNSVYDSKTEKWYTIDLTIAVYNKNKTAKKFSKCYMADKYYTAKSST